MGDQKYVTIERGVVAASSFCVLLSVAIIHSVEPANGYEIHPFAEFPWFIWISFITPLALSILHVFISLRTRRWSKYLSKTLVLLGLNYALFFAIPAFRGYHLIGRGSEDILAHIGHTKYILESGHLMSGNWYPTLHLLLAPLRSLGVGFGHARLILSLLFLLLFQTYLYLYVKKAASQRVALAAFALATPLYFSKFHWTLHPFMISFFFIPLFLYLLQSHINSPNRRSFLLLLVVSVFILFTHPITAVFSLLMAIGVLIRTNWQSSPGFQTRSPIHRMGPILVAVVILGFWLVQFHKFSNYLQRSIVTSIAILTRSSGTSSTGGSDGAPNILQQYLFSVKGERGVLDLLATAAQTWGAIFILALLCGFALLFFLLIKRRDCTAFAVEISLQSLFGAVIAVSMILLYFVASDPIRVSRYAIFFGILLGGLFISQLFGIRDGSPVRSSVGVVLLVVLLLVVTSGTLSFVSVYQTHTHLSEQEVEGTQFVLDYRQESGTTVSATTSMKMTFYMTGKDPRKPPGDPEGTTPLFLASEDIWNGYQVDTKPLESGMVGTIGQLSRNVGSDFYLITKAPDWKYHLAFDRRVQEYYRLYTKEDVEQQRLDPTTNLVYSNSEFHLWRST